MSSTSAVNPGAGSVRMTASVGHRVVPAQHTGVERHFGWYGSVRLQPDTWLCTKLLTTSISCRARSMISAANVIPTASRGSHVQLQGEWHSVETFPAQFVNGLDDILSA